jgi:hypothetical protein
MNEQDFNKIMEAKNISDAKSGLALESKEYMDLSDACSTIGNTLIKISKMLEKTSQYMDKIAVDGVTTDNALVCTEISKEAYKLRDAIEERLRFTSAESHDYFNDLASSQEKVNEYIPQWLTKFRDLKLETGGDTNE